MSLRSVRAVSVRPRSFRGRPVVAVLPSSSSSSPSDPHRRSDPRQVVRFVRRRRICVASRLLVGPVGGVWVRLRSSRRQHSVKAVRGSPGSDTSATGLPSSSLPSRLRAPVSSHIARAVRGGDSDGNNLSATRIRQEIGYFRPRFSSMPSREPVRERVQTATRLRYYRVICRAAVDVDPSFNVRSSRRCVPDRRIERMPESVQPLPSGEALTPVIDTCAERPTCDSVLESDLFVFSRCDREEQAVACARVVVPSASAGSRSRVLAGLSPSSFPAAESPRSFARPFVSVAAAS